MDKFLIRKKLPENSVESTSGELAICGEDEPRSSSAINSNTKRHKSDNYKKNKICTYQDTYIDFGFTWCGDEHYQKPKCVVCGETLSNGAMNPRKLKRHLSTKHEHLAKKSQQYFKNLLSYQKTQSEIFMKKVTISDKVQEASLLVAELIAKNMKPHNIGETLILPACSAIVKTILGPEAEEGIKKIPLSNDTIARRIVDLSSDIEKRLVNKVTESKLFSMQLDESTDVGEKVHLLAFIRIIEEDKITEDF